MHQVKIQQLKSQETKTVDVHMTPKQLDTMVFGRAAEDSIDDSMLIAKQKCPYKVILSLTSSPKRIAHVPKILSLLDSRTYDEIHVNLPERYGRTNEPYSIDLSVSTFPKLSIFRSQMDSGPAMKLLPTVKRCQEPCVVITIDDDTVYGRSMVGQLLKALDAIDYQGAVGYSAFQAEEAKDQTRQLSPKEQDALSKLQARFPQAKCEKVLEGFGMVAYMSHLVNVPEAEFASSLSRSCFNSDDLVISYSLEKAGVPRFVIPNTMGNCKNMQLLLGY
jgi:hypothetical protein